MALSAPARLPTVHPFAPIRVLVGTEDGFGIFDQVLFRSKKIVATVDNLSSESRAQQIVEVGDIKQANVSSHVQKQGDTQETFLLALGKMDTPLT